jgi:hypothetical protein
LNNILLIIVLLLFALPAGAKESPQSLLAELILPSSSLLEHSEVVTHFPDDYLLIGRNPLPTDLSTLEDLNGKSASSRFRYPTDPQQAGKIFHQIFSNRGETDLLALALSLFALHTHDERGF